MASVYKKIQFIIDRNSDMKITLDPLSREINSINIFSINLKNLFNFDFLSKKLKKKETVQLVTSEIANCNNILFI